MPCRHFCICDKCCENNQLTRCPLCRGRIEQVIDVHSLDVFSRYQITQKGKQLFLMFAKVLMRYLKAKDISMYSKAKATIHECASKKDYSQNGYLPLSESMKLDLREVVGDYVWGKAKRYLEEILYVKIRSRGKALGTAEARKRAKVDSMRAVSLSPWHPIKTSSSCFHFPYLSGGFKKCVICKTEHCNILIQPCQRLLICEHCNNKNKILQCPLCNTRITNKVQIYL